MVPKFGEFLDGKKKCGTTKLKLDVHRGPCFLSQKDQSELDGNELIEQA